ncbi:hypothetical protein [Methylobacterium iners]|uniref:Uncharacterized protein n=1 Tax=Methylobacterium iners TaxID=418707 RepID=A0ABQ4S7F2_9HYPH|nr:hypothetical protein [Methylobacterium iners]GJD97728.1 hypothetical protein OCOJLMKI_4961 [Methylobacterium iners]
MEKDTIVGPCEVSAYLPVTTMLLASRTVLQEHREIAAVAITYGMFIGAILMLAWAIA